MLVYLLSATLASVGAQEDASSAVDVAMRFMREACTVEGRVLEITIDADGSLRLSRLWEAGVDADVSLNRQEVSGLGTIFVEGSEGEPEAMRACYRPYIDRILDYILAAPDEDGDQ